MLCVSKSDILEFDISSQIVSLLLALGRIYCSRGASEGIPLIPGLQHLTYSVLHIVTAPGSAMQPKCLMRVQSFCDQIAYELPRLLFHVISGRSKFNP